MTAQDTLTLDALLDSYEQHQRRTRGLRDPTLVGYSRFVRPGYVRVGTVSASNTTLVTAYRGDEKLVIVVINDSNGEQAVNVSIRGVPIPHSFSAVRSSRKENWKELQPIVPNGSSFRLVLAPQSVATLVGTIE